MSTDQLTKIHVCAWAIANKYRYIHILNVTSFYSPSVIFSSTSLLYTNLFIFIIILEQLEISVIKLLESACVKSRKNISILSVRVLIILGKLSFRLSKVDFVPAVKNIA